MVKECCHTLPAEARYHGLINQQGHRGSVPFIATTPRKIRNMKWAERPICDTQPGWWATAATGEGIVLGEIANQAAIWGLIVRPWGVLPEGRERDGFLIPACTLLHIHTHTLHGNLTTPCSLTVQGVIL